MPNKFYSPLRYPGGKTALAPLVKSLVYENNLVGGDYVELYAGGAGVALSLLLEEYVSRIQINDLDRSIYALWHSAVHKNERFMREIENIPVTMKTWHAQKEVQNNKKNANLFELGVSTFFLNRTNVSGILTGGVIGGFEQSGKYKIDARFNKPELLSRLEAIGKYARRIKVSNENAVDLLDEGLSDKVVYLDPPYVKKSQRLYMNTYSEDDHKAISKILTKKCDFFWILSYDQDPLIEKLYRTCRKSAIRNMTYGTSRKSKNELIYFHPRLKVKGSMNDRSLNLMQR
ncbi:MAG: DNA adenine methylase [Gammaproteobacteria bacterium AqS3]|nr:DNA adenine methylase [Gammaproteobacteria bacterium AqS3]